MLSELRKELAATFSQLRHCEDLRTITLAKPYCTPARNIITSTFQQYGVKLYGYKEYPKMAGVRGMLKQLRLDPSTFDGGMPVALPIAQIAEVTVSAKAAAWSEYLLLRTGQLYVPGQYVNRRNAEWAAKHGGVMPPAWSEGKPWIEKSCSEGIAAWEPLRKAAQRRTMGRKRRGR